MVIIQSTASFIQASGTENTTIQGQFGAITNANTVVQGDAPDNLAHIVTPGIVAGGSNEVVQFEGASQTGNIILESPFGASGEHQFVVFLPDFSRGTTLFGAIGTTDTVEKFFDRTPFFFTPPETDPNTLRDISEAQKFLVFSSATIFGIENVRRTPGFTTLITVKGEEIDDQFIEPDNVLVNGSFESGISPWVVATGILTDISEVRADQPLGVGFNDLDPVSPPDGDLMLYMNKDGSSSVLTTMQTVLLPELESSQLRSFGVELAPSVVGTVGMPFAIYLLFKFRDEQAHNLRYHPLSSPSFPQGIPELSVIDDSVDFSVTEKVFNSINRNILEDTSFASFKFDELQLWLVADANVPASGTHMLIDDISVTISNPAKHLNFTESFAHINTDDPTASGLAFTISGSDDITQEDKTGPFFDETSPASGTTFNVPDTQVEFHIKDGGSPLDQATINIFIDGLQVVSVGTTVTGTTWPIASKTVLSPNNIEYIFTRGEDFLQQSLVVVSGAMADFATPANLTDDAYSFTIMGSGILNATISGAPDADPPVITALDPAPGATQVSPNTAIIWTTADDASGVDPSTVKLFLNGGTRVDGSAVTSGSLSRVANSDRGFDETFTPVDTFEFGSTVTGTIEADDNDGNSASLTYEFTITPDDTLDITNFFLAENESILLTSGTELSVCVEDFTHGVNASGTFLTINDDVPAGLITAVSGTPSSGTGSSKLTFTVLLEPIVDFREELTVLVHAENNFPGSFPVIEEKIFLLRPGYDVTWPNKIEDEVGGPSTTFPFITNVQVLADIKNFAKNFGESTEFFRFLTEEQAFKNLGASLISNIEIADLSATLVSLNPFFVYSKTMVLEIEADDLEGNQLRFTHTFTIEPKPT